MRAFQKYFCFPNSTTPIDNDFGDFQQYFIKCTIPQALARIKDGSGDTRNTVKLFLIKLLKFNDNSNNDVCL
jgi:transcription initiation factor TFIID subunit 2